MWTNLVKKFEGTTPIDVERQANEWLDKNSRAFVITMSTYGYQHYASPGGHVLWLVLGQSQQRGGEA